MEDISSSTEVRLGKGGSPDRIGMYVLAISHRLSLEEIAHFPRTGGIRAEAIINHARSQSFPFRTSHFAANEKGDRDPAFIEFAAGVRAHYGIASFDSTIRSVEDWQRPLFDEDNDNEAE